MNLLLLTTAGLLLSSLLFVFALGMSRTTEIAVGVTVIAGAQIVGLSLLVGGLMASYRPVPLALAVGAVLEAVLIFCLFPKSRNRMRRSARALRPTFDGITGFSLRHPLLLLLIGLLTLQYMLRLAMSIRLPPYAYDALTYHLTAPAQWTADGRVQHTPVVLEMDTYPLNIEVIMGWPMMFLHSDEFTSLARLPFYFLGGLATTGIARELGARRSAALLAGVIFLAMPAVFVEVFSGYVDGPAIAFALAAVFLAMRAFAPHRIPADGVMPVLGRLLLAGCAAGLAVGSKQTNLGIFALVAVFCAIRFHQWHMRGASTGQPAAYGGIFRLCAVAFVAPSVALGGYWYIDTWIEYGSPFHPVAALGFPGPDASGYVGVFTPDEVKGAPLGMIGGTIRSWIQDLTPDTSYTLASYLGGYGAVWLVVVLPLAAYGVWRGWRRDPAAVVLVCAALGALLVFSPAPWWTRVNLGTPAFAAALAAVGLTLLSTLPRRILWATATALLLFTGYLATSKLYADVTQVRAIGPATAIRQIINPAQADQGPFPAHEALDRLPRGEKLGVMSNRGMIFTYPLIGRDMRRRLVLLDPVGSAQELRAQMMAKGLQFVLLESREPFTKLVTDIRAANTAFRPVTSVAEAADSAQVYQLGSFSPCERRESQLALRIVGLDTGSPHEADLRLLNACGGPIVNQRVEIWRGPADQPVWSNDLLAGIVYTGQDGTAFWTGPADPLRTRYFARYAGDGTNLAAATGPNLGPRPEVPKTPPLFPSAGSLP